MWLDAVLRSETPTSATLNKGRGFLMAGFTVEDSLHSHPKALEASLAAIGLWTLAGSWSGDHRKDGFVSDRAVESLSRGSVELADELVAAGLWKRAKGGYRFHQWEQRNPTASEADRITVARSIGGALGNHLRWHTEEGKQKADCQFCQGKQVSVDRSDKRSDTDRSTDRGAIGKRKRGDIDSLSSYVEEEFPQLWAIFPQKKGGRAEALKRYTTARKNGTTFEQIMAGVQAYSAERRGQDPQFTKRFSSWLSGRRWEDEPAGQQDRYAPKSLWDN